MPNTKIFTFSVDSGSFKNGTDSTEVKGEIELELTADPSGAETARLLRLDLYSPRIVSWRGTTGELNIEARSGQGNVVTGQLQVILQAGIQFTERTESGYPQLASLPSTTAQLPRIPFEPFQGTLVGKLEDASVDGTRRLADAVLRLLSSREASVSPRAVGGAELVDAAAAEEMNLGLNATAIIRVPAPVCPADRQTKVRVLNLQPVFFNDGAGGPPTGATWGAQVGTARNIWSQCCIQIVDLSPIVVPNAAAMVSGIFNTVVSALPLSRRNPEAVHVFVVDNHLPPGDGGGLQFGSDIVMTDANAGNSTLLAHEIGHVLNVPHDAGNVMEPSGSPNVASPPHSALHLCSQILFTKLKSGGSCCLTAPAP